MSAVYFSIHCAANSVKDKHKGLRFLVASLQGNSSTFSLLPRFYLLNFPSVQPRKPGWEAEWWWWWWGGAFPSKQYQLSDKRKDEPDRETERREREREDREAARETESMNGLEATSLAPTKGGRETKTSGVNMLFHSLSQTVPHCTN